MRTEKVNSGIYLPIELHRLLRDAARGRQRAAGGRGKASVSELVTELLGTATARAKLEELAKLESI